MATYPCALSIAGLDPGGGAGILADVRAFKKAGVFGTAALALTTVQSTRGLQKVVPLAADLVVAQAREVLEVQDIRAVKLGALGSRANVRAVASLLCEAEYARLPLVLDPVMVPGRGPSILLDPQALSSMRKLLLPRAWVVTANTDEAEALIDGEVHSEAQARDAAHTLCEMGAAVSVVKGGHLQGPESNDIVAFQDGSELWLRAKRLPVLGKMHGGGCTFAALLTGRIAAGHDVRKSLMWAKRTLTRSIENMLDVGGPLGVLE